MSDLRANPVVKTIVVILFVLAAAFMVYAALGAVFMDSLGGYAEGITSYDQTEQAQWYSDFYDGASPAYSFQRDAFALCYPLRNFLPIAAAVSAVLALAFFLFLLFAAGHRRGREEIMAGPLEKIPLDLFAVAVVGIIILLGFFFTEFVIGLSFRMAMMLVVPVSLALVLLVLSWFLSLAIRVKQGKWWKNTLVYMTIYLCFRLCRWFWRSLLRILSALPLVWQMLLFFSAFTLVNTLWLLSHSYFLWLLFTAVVCFFLCAIMLQMTKLRQAAKDLAGGKENTTVDMRCLWGPFRKHGEDLNRVSAGISRAVDARMKSERMKAELIANVSHDIKTPLTSIINYVDLLKKEDLSNETAKGYLDVLDRQSARLKKLTEDVIEASKAATGNLIVDAAPTNVAELLHQVVAEYGERFAAAKITPVVTLPERELMIMADGRLLWRVFDNLLSNICKYSLPETRAYISVEEKEGRTEIVLKNISRALLNTDVDELIERFVQGDTARSSEGSGLGLSIAQSLTQLQKGQFFIRVDGDLFKVIVSFARFIGQ